MKEINPLFNIFVRGLPSALDIHINDSEIDDSAELPVVNANDAIKSLELVRSFLQQQEDSKELLKHVNTLDYYIGLKLMNAKKQTTIDNFFNQK